MPDRVVVIGGGAAGLMAAGRAAECAARVLLVEKTGRLGQKLALSGGGHGNITHVSDVPSFLEHIYPRKDFLRPALRHFGPRDTLAFFERRGLPIVIEEDGRAFPASRNAHDVVAALRAWCLEGGVQFRFHSPVQEILVQNGAIYAVKTADGKAISASAVILATGGMSYPHTGSSGDGYRLASALGHTILPPRPGLVPLIVQEPWCTALQGVSLKGVVGWLEQEGKRLAKARGDVVLTHFGLSGPLALSLSLHLGDALEAGPITLGLDLIPSLTQEAFEAFLVRQATDAGRGRLANALHAFLPKSLVEALIAQCGLSPDLPLGQLKATARRHLVQRLKRCPLTIVSPLPLEQATITLGGVRLEEVDPHTMASRRVNGLYFAGELLAVWGDTGGYNLQIAWTTGYMAGEAAAGFATSQGIGERFGHRG